MFFRAEVQPSQARLVVDCKDAPESAADLRHPECREAVLGLLEREFGIESVILSHYVERQYGPRAMEALRRILALANLLAQLATRAPAPNFPGMSKKQVAAKCAGCPFHPKALFSGMRGKLLRDFMGFRAAFADLADKLQRYREPGCRTCTAATTTDLVYAFQEAVACGEAVLQAAPPEEGTG